MGWFILVALIAAALAALWALGVRGGQLTATAAALFVAATGYAAQGSPDLRSAPATAAQTRDLFPLTEARHAFFGQFAPGESWLRISEALARDGQSADAVGILQNAAKRHPGDAQLWIGLGNALVDEGRGLTPPAELAYRRAAELDPNHPAAPFFYGLALARSGNREAALAIWRSILADAPKDAEWRPLVEAGVAGLSNAGPPQRQSR
jgi:cytochrome c-type biogenesis protein CcmH